MSNQTERAKLDEVLNALADVVTRAVPYGEDEEGFVTHYLSGTGAIHAAIPLLDRYLITVRPGGVDSRKAAPEHARLRGSVDDA